MKLSLLSLILGLLIFSCGHEASRKRNLIEIDSKSEEGEIKEDHSNTKTARMSEVYYDIFDNSSVEKMHIADSRSEALRAFLRCDKEKIDKLMETNFSVFSSGIWKELIQGNSYSGVKYLLTAYFLDNNMRRQAFRDSIVWGATSLARFILDKFKSALKRKSGDFVNLACVKKRYKILKMMVSEGIFHVNTPIDNYNDNGKYLLHNAVIANDFGLVKVLLKFKKIQVNCVDDFSNTPLHYASDAEIVKILLKHGANAFSVNYAGLDPVSFAIYFKRYDLVKSMVPDLILRFNHFNLNYKEAIMHKIFYQGNFIINRLRILEDSFYLASKKDNWYNLKCKFEIKFEGESGIDHGGLTREWMSLLIERFFVPRLPDESDIGENEVSNSGENENSELRGNSEAIEESEEINNSYNSYDDYNIESSTDIDEEQNFNENDIDEDYSVPLDEIKKYFYSPFECVDLDNKLYRISSRFTGPAEVYKFIGSIFAKSLIWNIPLKVKLVPSILKLLLGKTLAFEDLKDDDLLMYRSMLHCLEPGFDFDTAFYTMPSDENVAVNLENVERFLNETAVNSMYTRCKIQLDLLIEGFRATVYSEIIAAYFSPEELQNILSGADKIDRSEIYRNIRISGVYWEARSQMFWSAMNLLKEGELIELVRFITGINGLPFGGVSALGKILRVFDEPQSTVPKASTCNYHLSLPTSIQSVEELVEVFKIAISSEPEFVDADFCC
jgi:ankyrin repeat protein